MPNRGSVSWKGLKNLLVEMIYWHGTYGEERGWLERHVVEVPKDMERVWMEKMKSVFRISALEQVGVGSEEAGEETDSGDVDGSEDRYEVA
jgi:hypothetical protein